MKWENDERVLLDARAYRLGQVVDKDYQRTTRELEARLGLR